MSYVLVKYKKIKLLINDGLQIQPLIDHLPDIEQLNEKVTSFYQNLMNETSAAGAAIADEQRALISKIGYKIIGVPFTNHEAELYALNNDIEYEVFHIQSMKLHGNSGKTNAAKDVTKDAQVQFRTHAHFKSHWVKCAAAYKKEHGLKKFGLTDWIEMKLND